MKDLKQELKNKDSYIELLKQRIGELLDEIHATMNYAANPVAPIAGGSLWEDQDVIAGGSLWEDQDVEDVYLLVQYGDTWMTFNVETGRLYSTGSTPEEATEDLFFIDNTYEVVIQND